MPNEIGRANPHVARPTNETITGILAIREFVDWLYEQAPPEAYECTMPREKLIEKYWHHKASECLQQAGAASLRYLDEEASVRPFNPPAPKRPRLKALPGLTVPDPH